jgi:hypothetical protein
MKKIYLSALIILASNLLGYSQLNPTPYDLTLGNYTFSGFSNGTITTYPPNMTMHRFNIDPTAGLMNPATTTGPLFDNSNSTHNPTHRNEISNGISMAGNLNKGIGAICIALNTAEEDSVRVQFTARHIRDRVDVTYQISFEYRIGRTGNFTSTGTTYTCGASGLSAAQMFNVLLPSICWGAPEVQIRWKYYQIAGPNATAFTRDRVAIDDISISGKAKELKLRADFCGGRLIRGNDTIWSDSVGKAATYDYWVQGNGVDHIISGRLRPYFFLTAVPLSQGVKYNSSYNVQVRYDGGAWGPICSISTPENIPDTKIREAYCGATVPAVNSTFLVDFVPFATNYEYEVIGTDLNATAFRGSGATSFALSYITGYGSNGPQPGRTYSVRARAIIAGTDFNENFGETACNITVDDVVPLVKVRDTYCIYQLTTWSKTFQNITLNYAIRYDIQLLNASNNQVSKISDVDGTWSFKTLQDSATTALTNSTEYKIRVRAVTKELVGNWGHICTVNTPATGGARFAFNEPEENEIEEEKANNSSLDISRNNYISNTNVYPNPSNTHFNIATEMTGNKTIEIYNVNGQLIISKETDKNLIEIGEEIPKGIYILKIFNLEDIKTLKIIKE